MAASNILSVEHPEAKRLLIHLGLLIVAGNGCLRSKHRTTVNLQTYRDDLHSGRVWETAWEKHHSIAASNRATKRSNSLSNRLFLARQPTNTDRLDWLGKT